MPVLITGVAGFIGFHVAQRLCETGIDVVGIDNLNAYYSVELKLARLRQLFGFANFHFQTLDLANAADLQQLFNGQAFSEVIHLAAQAGVRYSLENPGAYGQANLVGFLNILEACRQQPPRHLIYASSSSVYGANAKLPFSVDDPVEQPVSLYAASKRANELMAHSYAHLYRLPTTGLRFFTVYGPWGRPDMALFKFTRAMLEGRPIEVNNNGLMGRDFTYIDDIVESVLRLRLRPPQPGEGQPPCQLFNIGRGQPVRLLHFIECLEDALGIKAQREYLPLQAGDVLETWADVDSLARWIDFTPGTSLEHGVNAFVGWYREFYRV
ncbi:protein CapI [Pseudomonas monteilii]|uniref:NAD-dependent epimerase/dehydratase family protein n=1 Tax=Pseudomonas kurunegalensis TaxID=485880 RepID=A0ACC5UTG7_9PSED|nr:MULTISPECIES: NAD-dependent epimerase/dehydratase family protein [Pseudomonas]AVH38883.1 protein CapI [Pseudomonas monteilii]MBV4517677.1 NAD-dependent epimerase/dehydratase family protein [Pseudomonas kurunegalensis]MBZ3666147.1 NAD-dependent epimerase/dehydratase family protein [Pseudomonas monteilii]MBZ3671491.1 NAD-dependent epimerase/dehydratase family protein [Pseudomonas monteilii]